MSVLAPTTDVVGFLRGRGINDDIVLEALAQYDPEQSVLSDDLSYEEQVRRVMELHDIPERFVDLEDTDEDHHETVATS